MASKHLPFIFILKNLNFVIVDVKLAKISYNINGFIEFEQTFNSWIYNSSKVILQYHKCLLFYRDIFYSKCVNCITTQSSVYGVCKKCKYLKESEPL